MNKELLMNNVKSVIVSNLEANESIIMDLREYNDVTQGGTYMAFTESRIFYWHENAASTKLKTKSYNLVRLVLLSRGVFAIHFNDEIIKLLISKESKEALRLIEILSPYVDIQHSQTATLSVRGRNKKKTKPTGLLSFARPKTKIMPTSLVRPVIIVFVVVLLSSLGTVGFSHAKDWWANRGVDDGLTDERVAGIIAEIESAEARIFMFEEYKRVIDNYALQLESIALDIEKIDPSDKAFDWVASENIMNNYRMILYNLKPREFFDTGISFNLDHQYATQHSELFYNSAKDILDRALAGLTSKFSNLPDLIALKQDTRALIESINNSIFVTDTEIGNVNAYISERRALINQGQ